MLVLTRKLDESLIVDGNIRVTVLDVNGKKVKLGIEAPDAVPIYRGEVQERIDEWHKTGVSPKRSTKRDAPTRAEIIV